MKDKSATDAFYRGNRKKVGTVLRMLGFALALAVLILAYPLPQFRGWPLIVPFAIALIGAAIEWKNK